MSNPNSGQIFVELKKNFDENMTGVKDVFLENAKESVKNMNSSEFQTEIMVSLISKASDAILQSVASYLSEH